MGKIRLQEQATPAIPPTDTVELYIDIADKRAKQIDDSGTIIDLTALTGGDADQIVIAATKQSVGTINPGQVVYVAGWNLAEGKIEVELADASSQATMPAIGIARGTITDTVPGDIVAFGDIGSINTNGLSVGDGIFVSETPGAFTTSKPQGTALIQKLATVTRVDITSGRLFVAGALRSNDLPNLAQQFVWVGDINGVPSEVSRSGIDLTAIHEDQAGEIQAIAEKLSPVAADVVLIEDSQDSNNKKKVRVDNLTGGANTDENVKVSANDTTAGYLSEKIVVAEQVNPTNVLELNELNDGANEDLEISFDETKLSITESQISDLGPYNNYSHPNHTGDVTSIGDGAQTIAANAVTNAKAADMPANTLKGNDTGAPADPQDLTPAEARALLNVEDGANNYVHPNHTGEVTSTGDGAQALDPTAITNKTLVTAAPNDSVLISDASDAGNLKRLTAQSIAALENDLVGASAADTTPDYLDAKLAAGQGVDSLTILNPAANEQIEINTEIYLALSGGQPVPAYVDSTRANKVLGVPVYTYTFSEQTVDDEDWIGGFLAPAGIGFIIPENATLVAATLYCEDSNGKGIDLYLDAVNQGNIITSAVSGTTEDYVNNLNIDIAQGQKVRLRADTTGDAITAVNIVLYVQQRISP